MALDPSISLQLQPLPQIDLTRIQQLRNLMGQEALMGEQFKQAQLQQQLTQAEIPIRQAQLPGTIAMSKQQTIAAETQEKLQKGRQKISEFLTEQVSRPGATGAIDHDEVILRAFREGLPEAAFEYQTLRNSNLAGQIKNNSDALNVADQQSILAASMLTRMPDAQRPAAAEQIRQSLNQQFKNTGMNIGDIAIGSLYTTDTKTGQSKFDNTKLESRFQSTVTYENQKRLDEAMDRTFFTPEAMDKNSALSKRTQDYMMQVTKGAFPKIAGMSARDIYRDEGLRQYFTNAAIAQISPPGARLGFEAEASKYNQRVQDYDRTLRYIDQLPKEYVDLKISVAIERAAQDQINLPILKAIESGAARHNAENPNDPIDITKLSSPQARAKLNEARARAQAGFNDADKKAGQPVLKSESERRTTVDNRPPSEGEKMIVPRKFFENFMKESNDPKVKNSTVEKLFEKFNAERGGNFKLVD